MEKGMNTAHILEDVGVYTHSYGSVSREQGKWQFRVQRNSVQYACWVSFADLFTITIWPHTTTKMHI